jgi:hypothetical protein
MTQPSKPGFYLRCGSWWTRVTPVHEYTTREGKEKSAYLDASNADPDLATRYDSYADALKVKYGVEKVALVGRHDIIEVCKDGSLVNWSGGPVAVE